MASEKKRLKVEPESGSRLRELLAVERRFHEEAKEAEARHDEVRQAIRAELQRLADPEDMPGAFDVPADPRGEYPAYSLTYHEPGWKLDEKAMKEKNPVLYVQWAKPTRGYWELRKR